MPFVLMNNPGAYAVVSNFSTKGEPGGTHVSADIPGSCEK